MPTSSQCLALRTCTLAILLLAFAATNALAGSISPDSYDTPNGDGQAHGGTYNYWDKNYSGIGSKNTDGSLLSGGRGDLIDNVIATKNWFDVENAEGTGPYVGWRDTDPTIVFHFHQRLQFSSITIHADDANGVGGVFAPAGIIVGGVTYGFDDPSGSAPNAFTVSGLSLLVENHQLPITILRQPGSTWTFVSEVKFQATAVPEAGSTAMLLAGLATVGALARRRARSAA